MRSKREKWWVRADGSAMAEVRGAFHSFNSFIPNTGFRTASGGQKRREIDASGALPPRNFSLRGARRRLQRAPNRPEAYFPRWGYVGAVGVISLSATPSCDEPFLQISAQRGKKLMPNVTAYILGILCHETLSKPTR